LEDKKEFYFKQVGNQIAWYRKKKDLTQQELADKAHISRSSIGKIECGNYNQNISLSMLIDIADALGINFTALFSFTKNRKIKNNGGETYEQNI
jgi:transcriptional regulator with XRE-family HTH domain